MSDTGTYVYAVGRDLDAEVLAGLEGVGEAPVRTLGHRDLTAVVSTVDLEEFGEEALRQNLESLAWVEKTARRHDEIVRRAAAITTALAPFRLVTIYRSDDAARDRIEELYDDLVLALDRIERRSEWSVKVFSRERLMPSAPVEAEAAGSGVAYLERRRAEIRGRQEAAVDQQVLADQLFLDLAPGAAATRRLAPQDQRLTGRRETMALNATFLVDDDRSTEFFELVSELRSRYPSFEIEVNGPWPPYSFAVLDKP
ncbi:GvpL/GvpF family gas vesicle protein [Kribbella sp. NPDC023972]|uniref:GvpL/GvpF family gas vesicle protein n=1 Tax=Kribbella sp. NPDC023972 TaxID=3154795 RepID=UPI0033DF0662